MNTDELFTRTQLLLGDDAMQKLQNSRVAVFGIGGVGSYTAEALCRSGVGALDLIDNDRVSKSNINRQLIALHSTIGQLKTDVMAQRARDINPSIRLLSHPVFFSAENAGDFDWSAYDYVVDAIDTVSGKIELVLQAQRFDVPIISSMGAGNKLNPAKLVVTDIYKTSVCPLARVMRTELRKRGIKSLKTVYSEEPPIVPQSLPDEIDNRKKTPGSTAFVPSVAGLLIAAEVVRDLISK